MLGDFDLEAAVQAIVADGRCAETKALGPNSPVYNTGNAHGIVQGDMRDGATARGGHSLLVAGAVAGSRERPCTVEVEGDVVIRNNVQNAQITARSIRIGGHARHCRLLAADGVEVGADLSHARLALGVYDSRKRQIEAQQFEAQRVAQERTQCELRLRTEEKRIGKMLRGTRITCQNTLSQIIRPRSNRIEINLQPFYQALRERTEDEIDGALIQFFARAVVGRLTQENRAYLKENASTQKAFTRLLQDLRQLFELTRRFDRYAGQVEKSSRDVSAALELLRRQAPELHVRGAIVPELEVAFVLPEVERAEDGALTFGRQVARLQVTRAGEAGQLEVRQVDRSGGETVRAVAEQELRGLVLRVNGGTIRWPRPGTLARVA